jgi:hypothetical protein
VAASRRPSREDLSVQRVLGRIRDVSARPGPPPAVLTWLASGRLDLVEELLGGLLATRRPTFAMVRTFREVLQRLARVPGPDSVAAVLRIAGRARATLADRLADHRETSPGPWLRNGDREIAAWLADGQPLGLLAPLFAVAAPDDELAACLLQEAVRRHGDLAPVTAAAGLGCRLRTAGHPLGHLPLRLLDTERVYAPGRRLEPRHLPDGFPAPYESRPRPSHAADEPPEPDLTAIEVEWAATRQARQALQDYQIGSDSEAESRLYLLDRPLDAGVFGAAVLLRLAPDCLGGAEGRQVRAWRAGAHEVWAVLYEQSLWGGPSGHGRGAAYSRVAAWGALAALCGTTGDPEDVERAAGECTWLLFDADSAWYLQVNEGLDVGIAVLWPDRQTAALLAATDSD